MKLVQQIMMMSGQVERLREVGVANYDDVRTGREVT